MADAADMRTPYRSSTDIFDIEDLASRDPFKQFGAWFEEACKTPDIGEANAMSLATATKAGIPSNRMVLMKGYDHSGFKFYTNHESRKAAEINENPHCAIMFYWHPLNKVVRIEGTVERLSEEVSSEYFHSRPRTSQLGSMSSKQSHVIESREVLQTKYKDLLNEYGDEDKLITKPDFWGGYVIKPVCFEFWQGQTNRIHDRICFRRLQKGEVINPKETHKGEDDWVFERLSS